MTDQGVADVACSVSVVSGAPGVLSLVVEEGTWAPELAEGNDWIGVVIKVADDLIAFGTLSAKAAEGVRVRVLHDWFGCMDVPRSFWKSMREAGVEARLEEFGSGTPTARDAARVVTRSPAARPDGSTEIRPASFESRSSSWRILGNSSWFRKRGSLIAG